MAVSLFTAIATDCGFFRYANTSAKTLHFAAELIELGAKPYLISEYIETKSFSDMLALIKVLQTLELHCNSRVACITVEKNMINESSDNTEGFNKLSAEY
jgi:phosphoesterase RecJ-like protein